MKKIFSMVLTCVLLLSAFAGCAGGAEKGEAITFEDTGFEQFVRTLLGREEGDIYEGDLAKFTCLRLLYGNTVWASTMGARNVDEANSLTEGELRDYDIEIEFDATDLFSQVGSWAELRYFTGLEDFEADSVPMDTLRFLSAMPNLANLSLTGDDFDDLSAIEGCNNLGFLALSIPTMEAPVLPDDPSKLIYLYLESDRLSDISGVAACTSLLHLDTSGDGVFGLSPLVGLPALREVELKGEGITDIQVLGECQTVESMTFSIDAIADIEASVAAMVAMPELRVLNLLTSRALAGDTGAEWFSEMDQATKNAINRFRSSRMEVEVLINGEPIS